MMQERTIQDALGTLKIYEIRGFNTQTTSLRPSEKYISERWVKASSAAEAIILALLQDPNLANEFAIHVMERTQEDANNWLEEGPFPLNYYLSRNSK